MSTPLTEEQMRKVERTLHALTKPMFVWRMAGGLHRPDVAVPGGMTKSAATRRANALFQIEQVFRFLPPLNVDDAVRMLEGIDVADSERAHSQADALLLTSVHPEVAAAYERLSERAEWRVTS